MYMHPLRLLTFTDIHIQTGYTGRSRSFTDELPRFFRSAKTNAFLSMGTFGREDLITEIPVKMGPYQLGIKMAVDIRGSSLSRAGSVITGAFVPAYTRNFTDSEITRHLRARERV